MKLYTHHIVCSIFVCTMPLTYSLSFIKCTCKYDLNYIAFGLILIRKISRHTLVKV